MRADGLLEGDTADPERHPIAIATATFFLLLVVSFFDVLGGFAVTLRSAQRDLTVEGVERAL